MILYTSPSPDWLMMAVNSSWVILPNPLGIHNAGGSYGGVRPRTALATLHKPGGVVSVVVGSVSVVVGSVSVVVWVTMMSCLVIEIVYMSFGLNVYSIFCINSINIIC